MINAVLSHSLATSTVPKNTENLIGQSPLNSEFQEIIIGLSATRKSETERQIVDGINCTR